MVREKVWRGRTLRIAIWITILVALLQTAQAGDGPMFRQRDYINTKPKDIWMKKVSIIVFSVLLLEGIYIGIAGAAPVVQWNQIYGGTYEDRAYSVQQTLDGGYIFAGDTGSYGNHQSFDAWLYKTDSNGKEIWNKTFGRTDTDDIANSVQQISDGGYVFAGQTGNYAWLVKTDTSGNELWNKTYGGTYIARSVRQTSDGGYILSGDNGYYGNAFLVKTDSSGNQEWKKTFKGTAYSVQQTSDGGYVFAGGAQLVKTDASGNELWNKSYNTYVGTRIQSVQQTSDGGYILAGTTGYAALIKTDASGNELWTKNYIYLDDHSRSGIANSVQQTVDQGYIIAGWQIVNFIERGEFQVAWFLKADVNGNRSWEDIYQTYPERKSSDSAESVMQTKDSGYIVAGQSTNYTDAWLIKVEGTSRSYTFQTTDNAMQIIVDGTPQNSSYTVSWTDGTTHSISVPDGKAIVSGQSQYVFTTWSGKSTSSSPSFSITASANSTGTYNANYKTQYYLTVNTDPFGLTPIPGERWYDSGASATTETAPANVTRSGTTYIFSTWKVDGNPVPGNPISVNMDTPHTATAAYLASKQVIACRVISSPGEYVLTADIINSTDNTCISITSSDVIFDGNGHTIDGVDGTTTYGVHVNNPVVSLTNVTVKNLTVTDWEYGIFLNGSEKSNLSGNTAISNFGKGINVEDSGDNLLNGNNASDNFHGISLIYSSNNKLVGNTVDSNNQGIYQYSSSNNFSDNNVTNNNLGIALKHSSDNTLIGNNISNNGIGIYFWLQPSENNKIYNNYLNNLESVSYNFEPTSNNYWNTTQTPIKNIIGGPYLGGNFWVNPNGTGFSQTCTDADGDGICDSPYILDANNTDYLPLTIMGLDTSPPVIIIFSPQGITYNTTSIPLIVSANETISTWLYSLNGGANVSFLPNTTITAAQGANTLIVYASDTAGNWNSSTVSFSVNSIPPVITITSPQNTLYTITNIHLNVSANEAISTWLYSLNGGANVSFTPNTTITALQGPNTITVYASDTAGNWNSSTVSFSVDSIPPVIVITSPINATYNTTSIPLNVSANEAISTWLYSLNGAPNVTFTPNVTITASEGSNSIVVYATDTANNLNSSQVHFYVDTAPPTITGSTPKGSNVSVATQITVTFSEAMNQASAQSAFSTSPTTVGSFNWSGNNMTYTPSSSLNYNTTYTVTIGIGTIDLAGNGLQSPYSWQFTTSSIPDTTPPVITIDSPQSTNYTTTSISLNVSANEAISTWLYSLNGAPNVTFTPNVAITASQGPNTLIVYANDTAGNWNSSTVHFSVSIPLIITITSPDNNSVNKSGYINVTVTLDRTGTATLNWEGTDESMNGGGTGFYKNKTGLLSGNFSFKVYANDQFGSTNVSETRNVTVDLSRSEPLPINNTTGNLSETKVILAPSENVKVTIMENTKASADGAPLTSISINSLAKINSKLIADLNSNGDKLIGENLSLGPAGARFSPDMQIRFNYSDGQLTAAGITESDLTVKYYEDATNKWEPLTVYERNTALNYLIVNVSHFSLFSLVGDLTPPASITNLQNISYSQNYINWTWIDPPDTDFSHVSIWINNDFKANVAKGIQYYNATGLTPDTEYTIATRTVDMNGNVNQNWVNRTARTAMPDIPLVITITSPDNNSVNKSGYVNVTVTLNRTGMTTLNWEGANESMNGTGISFYKNKTGLLSGNFSFKVYANDTFGSTNVSETRNVTVDLSRSEPLPIDNTTGNLSETKVITAPSGNVTVTILKDTNATTADGTILFNISIDSLAKINSTCVANLDENDKLIENLSLGPAGARFNPDTRMRFNYTDEQLKAAGTIASQLSVKFCNTTTNKWENQTLLNNETGRYIIANASHFSFFSLVAAVPPPRQPTPTTPDGGGGGGGGGGGVSGEDPANIEVKEKYDLHIFKDKVTQYVFTNGSNPIMFVNITGNVSAGEINTAVEVLRNTSSLVKVTAPGTVYKNFNIWVGTTGFAEPRNIKEALIRFKIKNSWITSNGLASSDVKLLRWINNTNTWLQLEAAEKNKDSTYTYYEAKANGFASFAVAGLKGRAMPTSTPSITASVEGAYSGTPAAAAIITPTVEQPVSWNWIMYMLGGLAIVVAAYLIAVKKKKNGGE